MGDAPRGTILDVAHRFAKEVMDSASPSRLEELCLPTYRMHERGGITLEGIEAAAARVRELRRVLPDMRYYVLDRAVDGDLVAEHWALEGTQRGRLLGIEPTGRPVRLEGMVLLRFESGRIAEAWQFWDRLELLEQLGEAPAALAAAAEDPTGEEPGGGSW